MYACSSECACLSNIYLLFHENVCICFYMSASVQVHVWTCVVVLACMCKAISLFVYSIYVCVCVCFPSSPACPQAPNCMNRGDESEMERLNKFDLKALKMSCGGPGI